MKGEAAVFPNEFNAGGIPSQLVPGHAQIAFAREHVQNVWPASVRSKY